MYSGPLYERMEIEGNKIRLHFTQVGTGLMAKGGESLKRFAIAGVDRKFVWGEAKIEGKTVTVSSSTVSHPVAVRYAWDMSVTCLTHARFCKIGMPWKLG